MCKSSEVLLAKILYHKSLTKSSKIAFYIAAIHCIFGQICFAAAKAEADTTRCCRRRGSCATTMAQFALVTLRSTE